MKVLTLILLFFSSSLFAQLPVPELPVPELKNTAKDSSSGSIKLVNNPLPSPVVKEEKKEWDEKGVASWYGGKFQGRLTANGETFDTHKISAAHKSLPFNTLVRVTNLVNGKTVEVRINDRGPFVEGRIIDLSMAAAKEIDMLQSGIASVGLEIVKLGDGKTYHKKKAEYYSIQIASYTVKENAETLFKSLKEKGFLPKYESSGTNIRVIIPDVHEADLEAVKERLNESGIKSFLVREKK